MLKWIFAAALLMLLLARTSAAKKLRLGDLPGDFRFQINRFKIHLPFTSTLLIALFLFALSRLIRI